MKVHAISSTATFVSTTTFVLVGLQTESATIVFAKGKNLPNAEGTQNLRLAQRKAKHDRLMDYHDRIWRTPNSTLNLGAGLNLLSQLLLPLLAFLLANLDKLLGLFFN